MRTTPRKFSPIRMISNPAATASGSCHTRRKRPTPDAPAPSATKTVAKPKTKAREVAIRMPRMPAFACASAPDRKSSTDTPAM